MSPADNEAAEADAGRVALYDPGSLLGRLRRLTANQRQGGAELVPRAHLLGPMPWVVAIMVALTVIAAAGALALANVTRTARADLAGGLTVQILEPASADRLAHARAVLAVLAREDGVGAVRLVPDSEVDALLSPWLGAGAASDGNGDAGDAIPVPALIDAHLDGAVTAERLAMIRGDVLRVAPAARIDAQAGWLKPVFSAIAALGWLALALILLLAAALAAAVLLAVRTALGTHRETIAIVHMLGGADAQIARIFERAIGRDAAIGGLAGLAVAGVVIFTVGMRFAELGTGLVAGGTLRWFDWLALAAIPLAGVVLAMVTARISVLTALRKML